MMARMTSGTQGHQQHGKSVSGSPGLGCSGRVGLRDRGPAGNRGPTCLGSAF